MTFANSQSWRYLQSFLTCCTGFVNKKLIHTVLFVSCSPHKYVWTSCCLREWEIIGSFRSRSCGWWPVWHPTAEVFCSNILLSNLFKHGKVDLKTIMVMSMTTITTREYLIQFSVFFFWFIFIYSLRQTITRKRIIASKRFYSVQLFPNDKTNIQQQIFLIFLCCCL